MRLPSLALFGLVCVVTLASCEVRPEAAMRSGDINDDDVEEPLAGPALKYEAALRASNALVQKLVAHNYHSIYQDSFDDAMRSQMTEQALTADLGRFETRLGPIQGFKPMQWNFSFGEEKGEKFVTSAKIVRYQKRDVTYRFVFPRSGPFDRIIGMQVKLRPAKPAPH